MLLHMIVVRTSYGKFKLATCKLKIGNVDGNTCWKFLLSAEPNENDIVLHRSLVSPQSLAGRANKRNGKVMNPKQPCFHSKLYLVDEDSYNAVALKSHSACESVAAAFFSPILWCSSPLAIIHDWAKLGSETQYKSEKIKVSFYVEFSDLCNI